MKGSLDRRRRPIAVVFSVALVLVAIALAAQGGDGAGPRAPGISPRIVDAGELARLGRSLGQQIYWAGHQADDRLELTQKADGSLYLRYLPLGVDVGDPRPRFLTVGTYAVTDAVGKLRRTAARSGATVEPVPGGVLFLDPASERSAYLAPLGSELQIEVYHPRPGRALELIRAGAIRPLG